MSATAMGYSMCPPRNASVAGIHERSYIIEYSQKFGPDNPINTSKEGTSVWTRAGQKIRGHFGIGRDRGRNVAAADL
ncbi:MAG: hypothetical protein AAFP98_08420, partial [Pseudomonadota bacterium]